MRTAAVIFCLFAASLPALSQDTQKITEAISICNQEAQAGCRWNNIRCRNYRRAYLKVCLISRGVPPEYIEVLLMP